MKVSFLCIYTCCFTLLGCKGISSTSNNPNSSITTKDTIIQNDEFYLAYHYIDSLHYRLEWGRLGDYVNESTAIMKVLPSGVLQVKDFDHQMIVLTQSCGTVCSYSYLLPLYKNALEKYYPQTPYLINKNAEILIYEASNSSTRGWFVIENYITGAKGYILHGVLCHGPNYTYCTSTMNLLGYYLEIDFKIGEQQALTQGIVNLSLLVKKSYLDKCQTPNDTLLTNRQPIELKIFE